MISLTGAKVGRHIVGILLLLCVVFLWTSASFLMSYMFHDQDFKKPLFTTYLNTSTFAVYLLVVPVRRMLQKWWMQGEIPIGPGEYLTADSLREDFDEDDGEEQGQIPVDFESPPRPLTTREECFILQFCIIWFFANYFTNASLTLTSVASSTVLSCSSSFWTLVIGIFVRVEKFSFMRLIAVFISILGVVLISSTGEHSSDGSGVENNAWGDLIALLGAVFYGCYITLVKYRVGDESRLDAVLFFGFVGMINAFLLWPLFFIFDGLGIESFELPPSALIWKFLLLNAFLGTCLSEILWLISMLMTTPLIATMGISLTIPIAVVGDFFKGAHFSLEFGFGALFVVLSFVAVNIAGIYAEIDEKFDNFVRNVYYRIKGSFGYRQIN